MKRILMSAFALIISVGATEAFAGGYEKNTFWSGRWAGLAGAAASSVSGAEGLFFNPAGLVMQGEMQNEFNLNVTPTIEVWENKTLGLVNAGTGGLLGDTDMHESSVTSPPAGILFARKMSDQLTLGAGFYTIAGSQQDYDLDSGYTYEVDLMVNEFAVGGGYKLNEQWSIGASLRASMFGLSTEVTNPAPAGTSVDIQNAAATGFGFQVGAQYRPLEFLGIGLNYRSNVDYDAEGDDDVEFETSLPQKVDLGLDYLHSEMLTLYFQYSWTNYGALENEGVDAELDDTSAFRLGAEYRGWGVPVRVGYIYETATTTDDSAAFNQTPPGAGHTVALGTGFALSEAMTLNGAFEYFTQTGEDDADNEYNLSTTALHLGLQWLF